MSHAHINDLEGLLDQIGDIGADSNSVSIGEIQERLGQRSFGPMLIVAGVPPLTPLATLPGVATLLATIVLLTAAQMLIGPPRLWLPRLISRRRIRRDRLERVVEFLRPVVRALDKVLRPRLAALTERPFLYVIGICTCLLAMTMPPLEFVPLTSGIPSLPVVLFGLALTVRDGVLVLAGLAAMVIGIGALLFLGSTVLDALPL